MYNNWSNASQLYSLQALSTDVMLLLLKNLILLFCPKSSFSFPTAFDLILEKLIP